MTSLLSMTIFFTLGIYGIALLLALWRLLRGPAAQDRVLALDFISLIGMLVVLVIHHFVDADVPLGWPSMMAAIFFVGGMIVSVVGMVGIYVGNTFIESRNRPLYIIQDVISHEDDEEHA